MRKIRFVAFLFFFLSSTSLALACPAAPNLNIWLQANPNIAQALQWPFQINLLQPKINADALHKPIPKFPGLTPNPTAPKTSTPTTPSLNPGILSKLNYLQTYNWKPWQDWPASAKADLNNNFEIYWNWMCKAQTLYQAYQASGFEFKPSGFDEFFSITQDGDPTPLPEPPTILDPQAIYSSLTSQEAWNIYVKTLAFRLVLEAGKFLPWSLNEYNSEQLNIILAGSSLFKKQSSGFELQRALIPSSPLRIYSFLAQNKLLGKTRDETFKKIFEWERVNLFHAGVTPAIASEVDYTMMPEVYYHSKGNPTAARILEPTQCIYKGKTCSDIHYYTLGCGTTSFLNAYLFETLNIPAESKFIEPTGHMTWCSLGKCASHGDDPYSLKSASDILEPKGPASMLEILITEDQYNAWFGKYNPKSTMNVGRSTVDMDLKYIPLRLLRNYCNDGPDKPHIEGEVYQKFSHLYSVEELEAQQLWKKLDDKLKSVGGCGVVPYF